MKYAKDSTASEDVIPSGGHTDGGARLGCRSWLCHLLAVLTLNLSPTHSISFLNLENGDDDNGPEFMVLHEDEIS